MNKNKLLLAMSTISLAMGGMVAFASVKNVDGFAQFAKATGPEKSFTFDKDTTGFTNTDEAIDIGGGSYEDGYQFATGRYMDLFFSFNKMTPGDPDPTYEEQLKTFDSKDNFMEGSFLEESIGDIYLSFGVNNLQSISITLCVNAGATSPYYSIGFADEDGNDIGDGVEGDFTANTKTTISWSTKDEYDRGGNSNDIRLVGFDFGADTMTSFYIESIILIWSC